MMRFLFFIVLLIASSSYGQQRVMVDCEWKTDGPDIMSFPEVAPEFPGGEDSLFIFIDDHLFIPKDENGVQMEGIVYVRMIINQYGQITDPFVFKSTHKKLERYALALVKHMPDWKPAENAGKKVCYDFTLPIKFETK